MPKIIETKIKSLTDFTTFIDSLISGSKTLWYRGCGANSYCLVPRLYRHPTVTSTKELLNFEIQMISWFKQRSHIYLDKTGLDNWDYLFLMQHFGVPTRLLDWTENPFIGLYFAVVFAHKDTTGQYNEDAAVWILHPEEWNRGILKHIGYSGGIISIGDEALKGYNPAIDMGIMNSDPIAIYGTHSNRRIVAQRGVFTVFGKNINSMEITYAKNKNFKKNVLNKIIIEKDKIGQILDSLISIGYTDSVIFPDLEGLGKEIKRKFKYEV